MSSSNPPSDDLDRDALYSSDAIEADDDADYELEPPDPDVLTAEQRLAAERIAAAARTIDEDELLREDQRRLDIELVDELMGDFRFQFQIKHLLWATAVVAILAAVAQYSWPSSVLLGLLAAIGGVLTYLSWKEKQHEAVVAARRREEYSRKQLPAGAAKNDASGPPLLQSGLPELPRPTLAEQVFSICSPRELLIASVTAAVLLALAGSLLGLATTVSCLGIFALVGVVIQAVGMDMPRMVVLSLWAMLVLYILLSAILVVAGIS